MNQIQKTNKKALAVLLALIMLITVLPVTVFANGDTESNKVFVRLADPEEILKLSMTVTAKNKAGMQYQWFKYDIERFEPDEDNTALEGDYYEIPGATGESLKVVPTKNERYKCVAKDIYGNEVALFYDVFLKNNIESIDYTSEMADRLTMDQPLKMYRIIPSTRIKYRNPIKPDQNAGDVIYVTLFDKDMSKIVDWGGDKQFDSEVILEKGRIYYLKVNSDYSNVRYEESPYVIKPTAEVEPEELVYGKNLLQGDENSEQVFCFTVPETGIYDIDTQTASQMVLSDSLGNEIVTADYVSQKGVSIHQELNKGERIILIVKGIIDSEPYVTFRKFNDFYLEGGETVSNVPVEPGGSIRLEPRFHATDKSQMKYEWKRYDDEQGCFVIIDGATNSYLELKNIVYKKKYKCRAYDQYGNEADKEFRVYVDNDLQIGFDPDQDEPENPAASSKKASWIELKARTVTYNGKKQSIGKAIVKGSTGKVSYFYYKDQACKKKAIPRKAGVYYVIAKVAADSQYAGAVSKKVKLTIKKKLQKITIPKKSHKKLTNHIAFGEKSFSIGAKTNGNGKIVYKSSNPMVVKVSKKGIVKIVGSGKATIKVFAEGTTDCVKSKVKKYIVTVYPYSIVKSDNGRTEIQIEDESYKISGYYLRIMVNNKPRGKEGPYQASKAAINWLNKGDKITISIKRENEKNYGLKETIIY